MQRLVEKHQTAGTNPNAPRKAEGQKRRRERKTGEDCMQGPVPTALAKDSRLDVCVGGRETTLRRRKLG